MKKSMLNVIILALVLVNLVLTVILTFSLVSTNKFHMLIMENQDMPYFQYLSDLIQKLRIIVLYRLQLIMG